MIKPRWLWIWVFLFFWLLGGATNVAGAQEPATSSPPERPEKKVEKKAEHKAEKKPEKEPEKEPEHKAEPKAGKKVGKKAGKKDKKAAPEPGQAAAPEPAVTPKETAAEPPETFLSRAREQEGAGDISGSLATLSKFINIYPRHPERAGALLRMGQLLRDHRPPHQARPIYSLAASLYPDSQVAAEARWQVLTLEFYQDLREGEPLAGFRGYLQKLSSWPGGVTADQLREPIKKGWQEVGRAIQGRTPCPVNLVEGALVLWELHPEGTRPPEAALLLGELLQENGLYGEARSYLLLARDQGPPQVRAQALVGLLEGAWSTKNLPDFAGAWMLWRQNREETSPALKTRLEKLPLPEGFFSEAAGPGTGKTPEEDALAALFDWWSGKTPDASRQAGLLRCLEHFLLSPLPRALKERLQLQLAQLQWSQGNFPHAARIYKELLAANAKGENAAFYRDRLALAQIKGRHPDAALEIFQGLSQEGDNFWQLLSRTRLADVELRRLQTEPTQ